MQFSPNMSTVGYITAFSIIAGLMAFVVTGVSAIDHTKPHVKISQFERR